MADAPITNEQIEYFRRQIEALETQKRIPLPTPEIGRIVWFFNQGDLTSDPIPAMVQRQDSPGQISIQLHPLASQVHPTVMGVHFKDHPFLEDNPQVAKMKGRGVWTYRDGEQPTQAHKALHVKQLDEQIKALNAELLNARTAEIRRQQRDKELAAADSKPTEGEKTKKATAAAAS